MSVGLYGNVGGAARKASKLYGNVGGVTRKIKGVYANVNGVVRKVYSGAVKWTTNGNSNPYINATIGSGNPSKRLSDSTTYSFSEPLTLNAGDKIITEFMVSTFSNLKYSAKDDVYSVAGGFILMNDSTKHTFAAVHSTTDTIYTNTITADTIISKIELNAFANIYYSGDLGYVTLYINTQITKDEQTFTLDSSGTSD